jgi:hypothetical protein
MNLSEKNTGTSKLSNDDLLLIQKEIYNKFTLFEGENGFEITSESLLIVGTK